MLFLLFILVSYQIKLYGWFFQIFTVAFVKSLRLVFPNLYGSFCQIFTVVSDQVVFLRLIALRLSRHGLQPQGFCRLDFQLYILLSGS